MPKNWESRQKKLDRKRLGMRVSGKSVFVLRDATRKTDQRKIDRVRKEDTNAPL